MSLIELKDTPVTTAADWLCFLFGKVEAGWVILFSVDRETGRKHTDWFTVDDLEAAGAQAERRAQRCCVWYGVATRRERLEGGKRGSAADCVVIVGLWLDIDTAHGVHGQDNLPPDTDTALELVDRFPLPPTAIIDSGHGIQPTWVFTEPLEVADLGDLLKRWQHTWERIVAPYHLDNVSDVARVMRPPGTVNRKADPVAVEVLDADWSRLYGRSEIEDQLDTLPESVPARPRRHASEGLPGQDYSARHDGADLLVELGCTFDHTDRDGNRHYRRDGRSEGETGATIYADDGHITIYSETLAGRHRALEVKRPYDPFGLYAVIYHDGDHAAAASELRGRGYGTSDEDLLAQIAPGLRDAQPPANVDPETGEVSAPPAAGTPVLPEEFWTARDELVMIRDAARNRRVPPDSVLGVVFTRVAVETSHNVKVPAVTGAPCGLTYYAAIVSPPGSGKSGAQRVAALLVPASPERPEVPSGSGEGLLEQLFGMVEQETGEGTTEKVRQQVRHGAHVVIGEGTQLFETANRQGSTTMSVIREAYTDGVLGNTNASEERRRVVPAGQVVYGVSVAMQPEKAGPLLDDADAGTPQRFAWFAAVDPNAPDVRPDWPEFTWTPPNPGTMQTTMIGRYNRQLLDVVPEVLAEIDSRRLEVLRGVRTVEPMDEHRDLVRLKTAALLAILAQRPSVRSDDWHLAGIIMDTSAAVRSWTQARLRVAQDRREVHYRDKLAGRDEHTEAAERRRITQRAVGVIARKVRRDGTAKRSTLTAALPSKYRSVVSVDEVIAEAIDLDYMRLEGDQYVPGGKVHK